MALHHGQASVYSALKRRADRRWAARFRVVVAGRRWGKTHEARAELVTRALKLGAGRYWYLGPTLKAAKDIFWEDLKAVIDRSWLADKSESELYIRLRNDAELRLHGADDPDNLRGRPLRFVLFDEFADMKARTWAEVIRPALADWKAPALFIGTPKSFNHFYEFYERGHNPDPRWENWQSWQFRSIDNPTLDPEEIEEARRTTDPRTFRQEWEATFEALAGRAYYAFQRAVHRKAVVLEKTAAVCISFDFNVNPATAVIGQKVLDEARVWREVFVTHAGGEATRASAMKVKQLLADANWKGPIRIYGDPAGTAAKTTGPADHVVLREVFPLATWAIPSSHRHVRDRVSAVNSRCETMDGKHHLAVDPSCVHVIADLEQVTFKDNGDLDKTSNPMLTHVSDALGYWIVEDWPPVKKGGAAEGHAHWL